MHAPKTLTAFISVAGLLAASVAAHGQGTLTVELAPRAAPPVALVSHDNAWFYRLGTNHPGAGWQTNADATLDATWRSGAGGFGFADNSAETALCQTIVTGMVNRCTSFYYRRSFDLAAAPDPAQRLTLTMDWDDGFVAYLNGVEVAREMTTNAVGQEPLFNATASGSHESSRGNNLPANPPKSYDLGPASARLQTGANVLAIVGLNNRIDSTDFIQIADLSMSGGALGAVNGAFFALVPTNTVALSGSNTVAGSTRVVVNGLDAAFNQATGQWSQTQPLQPGWNELFIAAPDAQGNVLASTNRAVVAELSSTPVGGGLTGAVTWTTAMGVIRVTNTVTIPDGATLDLAPGVVVLLSANASLRAWTNGLLNAAGSEAAPVYLLPADGTTPWGEVSARGAGAAANLSRVELVAGQVIAHPASRVTVEDSLLREFRAAGRLFLTATNARSFELRRSQISRYDQIRFAGTPIRIEDCLFEYIGSDATDLADHGDIQVRRTTYRFGAGSNTDALDLGNNPGLLVEQCLIHDFPDKGVSIAQSDGVTVRGSLIYRAGIGIACYASTNCLFTQNTVADSTAGFSLYTRAGFPGPGQARATNNILWGNTTNIHLAGNGALALGYSDVEGTNWPGDGNLSSDPLFADAARGDFRLAAGSPAAGAGLDGVDMGAVFPVGGIPPAPFDLAAHALGTGPIQVWWKEDADNETGFAIERSTNGLGWLLVGSVGANTTNFTDAAAPLEVPCYYRARATNASGAARWSNLAGAARQAPVTRVCGVLTSNTVWSPALGTIIVCSNLIVPTNVTLTVLAGSQIQVTNGASLRAVAGGTIEIAGTAGAKVRIGPLVVSNLWRELSAQFAGAALIIRHADIAGGQVTAYSNAVLVLEDSYLHDYRVTSGGTIYTQPLLMTHYALSNLVRRCHFENYYEILVRNGPHLFEDCLFEHMDGDALDFDAAQPGTIVRRCTFRHGNLGNVDAIDVGNGDLGGSHDVLIESCLMYDFPFDKGVSIGDNGASSGIVVSNCLIYGCRAGVQVKDNCFAAVVHSTLADNAWGFTNYNKVNPGSPTGGGHLTNTYNNILWGNQTTISMWNGSTLTADHCDLGNTNWPGAGNFDLDPLFVNAAERDYRLRPNSPCLGAGRAGADLGARLPVGAVLAPSNPCFTGVNRAGGEVHLQFYADSEKSYSVEWTDELIGGAWHKVAGADTPAPLVPTLTTVTDSSPPSAMRFYRLVVPMQP